MCIFFLYCRVARVEQTETPEMMKERCKRSMSVSWFFTQLFNSQDLIVNSPHQLLHISFQISYKNLVLDQDVNL